MLRTRDRIARRNRRIFATENYVAPENSAHPHMEYQRADAEVKRNKTVECNPAVATPDSA